MDTSEQGTRRPAEAASAASAADSAAGAPRDDARFLAALEDCSLPPQHFDHAAHVRAGYLYLRRAAFPQATAFMCAAIERYARALGKPERYHETVTVAFMALINEQLRRDAAASADGDSNGNGNGDADAGSWEQFRARHPQLLRSDALLDYYPRALLDSPAARRCFTLPPRPG